MPSNNDPAHIFARHSAYTDIFSNPFTSPEEKPEPAVMYAGQTCCLVSPVNLAKMKNVDPEIIKDAHRYQEAAKHCLNLQEEAKEALKLHQAKHLTHEYALSSTLKAQVQKYLKAAVAKGYEEIFAAIPDVTKIDLKTYNAHGFETERLPQTLNSVFDREEKSAIPEEKHAAENIRAILRVFASYGWMSYDNKSSPVKAVFNYGKDLPNAAFTGTALVFGKHVNSPFFGSTLDDRNICGHEFTHQVIEEIAHLIYYKQPGILNEHFADVFGKISDFLALSQTIEDAEKSENLFMGDNWIKDFNGNKYAIRSFNNPGDALGHGATEHPLLGEDEQSKDISAYKDIDEDEGGVHKYSGALNYAFYHAAKELGTAGWWDLGAIWFLALFSLNPNASFSDFTDEIVKAAEILFGEGAEKKAIINAFLEIGIYDQNFRDPEQFEQVSLPRR